MCAVYYTFNQSAQRHRENQQCGFSIRDADGGSSFIYGCVREPVKYLIRTLFQREASVKLRVQDGVIFPLDVEEQSHPLKSDGIKELVVKKFSKLA